MSAETRPEWADHEPEHTEADELVMHLERDQLVAETARPVPAAVLGRRAVLGLWALRVFAILVSAMVVYTFIARLH
jgi:hypothetical protein